MEIEILEDGSVQITQYRRRRWIIAEAEDTFQVAEQINHSAHGWSDIYVQPIENEAVGIKHVAHICRIWEHDLQGMVDNARKA